MESKLITDEVRTFLSEHLFLNVGTCDFKGQPNVAPKILLDIEDDVIYLADYVFGHSWENLKINPRISISSIDSHTLIGYQLNGNVEIVREGTEYKKMAGKLQKKEVQFSAERIIEGIRASKKHDNYEVTFPDHIVVFKVNILEVAEIRPTGNVKRKKVVL